MIETSHLSAFYETAKDARTQALDDVNLSVPTGSTCAIIGPSGCGKSTLLRILAGIETGYEGKVSFSNVPVNPKSHTIGFIPQNYGLLPWKTIRDNIRLSWRIKHRDDPVPPNEDEMLERLGLGRELMTRYPHELSGGQQQRASLARAFLLCPDVLLMDEPFSALDAITREEMQEVFFDLWRRQAVTTVLVTHYVEEALYLGESIAVLSSAPGHILTVIQNPLFAHRDTSPHFSEEKKLLRDWLMGKETAC